MEPNERQFAQRYRRWIDGYELQARQAAAIWQRIYDRLFPNHGSPASRRFQGCRGRKTPDGASHKEKEP